MKLKKKLNRKKKKIKLIDGEIEKITYKRTKK
jgi:hypothetical protein